MLIGEDTLSIIWNVSDLIGFHYGINFTKLLDGAIGVPKRIDTVKLSKDVVVDFKMS